jgi:hypothetical protein
LGVDVVEVVHVDDNIGIVEVEWKDDPTCVYSLLLDYHRPKLICLKARPQRIRYIDLQLRLKFLDILLWQKQPMVKLKICLNPNGVTQGVCHLQLKNHLDHDLFLLEVIRELDVLFWRGGGSQFIASSTIIVFGLNKEFIVTEFEFEVLFVLHLFGKLPKIQR